MEKLNSYILFKFENWLYFNVKVMIFSRDHQIEAIKCCEIQKSFLSDFSGFRALRFAK